MSDYSWLGLPGGALPDGALPDAPAPVQQPLSNAGILKLLMPVALEGVFDLDVQIEGVHLDAAQGSADTLLEECFPDTSAQLISSWERVTGIAYSGSLPPLAAREGAVVQKLQARGGLSKQYFIGLAALAGYNIQIEELVPLRTGFRAGDSLGADFCLRVYGITATVYYFRAGSRAGDLVGWFQQNQALEDLLNTLKPAHTYIFFDYS